MIDRSIIFFLDENKETWGICLIISHHICIIGNDELAALSFTTVENKNVH